MCFPVDIAKKHLRTVASNYHKTNSYQQEIIKGN